MSPAAPDPLERLLRAADRAAQAGLTPGALDRIERRVLRRAAPVRIDGGVPTWLPATAAAGAIALVAFLLGRWDGTPSRPGESTSVSAPVRATLGPGADGAMPGPAALARLGLVSVDGIQRVVLADFEAPGRGGVSSDARVEFAAGGFSGERSLEAPDGGGEIGLELPAAQRGAVVGVSIWVRAAGSGTTIGMTAELEDGTELVAESAQTTLRGAWRWALFPVSPERVRAAGGVRRVRFALAGRDAVKVDKMELWTTAAEGRR